MHTKLSLVALLAFAGSVVPGGFDTVYGLQRGNHHAQVRRFGGSGVPQHLSVRQKKSPKTGRCAARRAEEALKEVKDVKAPIDGDKPVVHDDKPKDNDDDKPKPKPQDNNDDDDKPKPKPQDNNDDDDNKGNDGGSRWTRTYTGGDTTFYDPGLNACGTVDSNDAYIAAMPHGLWDSWPNWDGNSNHHPVCHKKVRVTWQGKSVDVTLTDRCGGCEIQSSLDLSPNAFKQLAPLSAGRIHDMSWHFL